MTKSAQKIDSLKKKMSVLDSVKTPTAEYKDIAKQIADAEKKQAALNDRMEKFVELGGKTNSKQYKSMQYDAAELENTIAYAKGELQDLVDTGKAFTLGNSTAEFNNLSQQLSEEQARLNELTAQYQNAQNSRNVASQAQELTNRFAKLRAAASSAFSAAKKGTVLLGKSLGKTVTGMKKLAVFAGKAVLSLSGLKGVSKGLGSTVGHLGKNIFNLARSALIFNVLSAGFRQVSNGIGDAFASYLAYDRSLKSSINGLRAQLAGLQGSIASAFAPIVSAAVPYLSTLISWVTAAANAVAAFIATLTGKSSYKKAVANVDAVGASADGAADSLSDAKDAAEDLEKALGHYDELNVIDQPQESSSGSSGGSGSSGSAGNITYEDVEISSAISDFAEKVKEAWKNADFTEVGEIIGTKLNDALSNIPWDEIQDTSSRIGKSVATLINGAIEVDGLGTSIGNTIAEAINTGILGLEAFTGNLHWDSVGTFVKNGVVGALDTIKWDSLTNIANNLGAGIADALNEMITPEAFGEIGKSVANAVNTVVSGAYSFISNANWTGWGNSIASGLNNFFKTVDWGKAGLSFSDAVKGILALLKQAILKTDWNTVGNDIAAAIKAIDWTDILSDVGSLIWSAIKAALITWKSMFDAAPVETTILSAFALLKFTGIGSVIGTTIWNLISAEFIGMESVASANVAAAGFATTLATAIKTALGSTAVLAIIGAGVALIYKGVEEMLSDPDFLKNKDVEEYIKENPGALGDGAETPEIELTADVKINAESVEVAPQDTVSVEVENLKLPCDTMPTIDATVNAAELTNSQKKILTAVVNASTLTNTQKKVLTAAINANSLTNTQKKVLNSVINASSLTNTQKKVLSAAVKASSISGNGKKVSAGIKASRIISNGKYVSAKVKIVGQENIPTIQTKANFLTDGRAVRAKGGIYSHGIWNSLPQKADGGIFSLNAWRNIPKYAAGGSPHGTMFVAGEAGPEIVGHVGGRTEVLNKSQIASAMYSAVAAAMNEGVANMAYAVLRHMTECTNTVIANIGMIVDSIQSAANTYSVPQVEVAGVPNGYLPDTNRVNSVNSGGYYSGGTLDYDKLANTITSKLSGNIQISLNADLDGRAVYDRMIEIDRTTVNQTGKSGFER